MNDVFGEIAEFKGDIALTISIPNNDNIQQKLEMLRREFTKLPNNKSVDLLSLLFIINKDRIMQNIKNYKNGVIICCGMVGNCEYICRVLYPIMNIKTFKYNIDDKFNLDKVI